MAKEVKFVKGTPKRDQQGFEITGTGMKVGAVLDGSTRHSAIIQVIDHDNPEYIGVVVKTDRKDLEYLTEEMELCKLMCT